MNIAVVGFSGKMGKLICQTAKERGHTVVGIDKSTPTTALSDIKCDVVIDFSSPSALPITKAICFKNNAPLIYGTTGYDAKGKKLLKQIADKVPVLIQSNFSRSIKPFCQALESIATALKDWDVIVEEHHRRNKADSPSGTALQIKAVLEKYFDQVDVVSLRYGDVVGVHKVILTDGTETITLTHTVTDRKAFALGSVICAENLLKTKQ